MVLLEEPRDRLCLDNPGLGSGHRHRRHHHFRPVGLEADHPDAGGAGRASRRAPRCPARSRCSSTGPAGCAAGHRWRRPRPGPRRSRPRRPRRGCDSRVEAAPGRLTGSPPLRLLNASTSSVSALARLRASLLSGAVLRRRHLGLPRPRTRRVRRRRRRDHGRRGAGDPAGAGDHDVDGGAGAARGPPHRRRRHRRRPDSTSSPRPSERSPMST